MLNSKSILRFHFRSFYFAAFLFLFTFNSLLLFAQTESGMGESFEAIKDMSLDQSSKPTSKLGLGLKSQSALSSSGKTSKDFGDNYSFEFSYDLNDENAKIAFGIEKLNSKNDFHVTASQFFWSTESSSKTSELSVGRKINDYSATDRLLSNGLINPYSTSDQIRFKEQGLTGIHYLRKFNQFKLQSTLVLAHLPNQAPGVREENGQLLGVNRWAATPPVQLRFNDQLKDINYKIDEINYAKIINNQGLIGNFQWQEDPKETRVSMSYGLLPSNNVVISREVFADLSIRPQVNLGAEIISNEIFAADVQIPTGLFKMTIGFLQSRPKNAKAQSGREIQNFATLATYTGALEYQNDLKSPKSSWLSMVNKLSLVVSESRGGEIADFDSNGNPADFILSTQQQKFNKPVALSGEILLWSKNTQSVITDFMWIYDREQKGSLLDSKLTYSTQVEGLAVNLGVTVLGVESEDSNDKRFLIQNQQNDRIYGGLNYVY